MPSAPSPFSDEAEVKYISAAPGTRRLTLPCPFPEIAPLASTAAAVCNTPSTSSLFTVPSSRARGACPEGSGLAMAVRGHPPGSAEYAPGLDSCPRQGSEVLVLA
jgi:hypothetical protein